VSLYLDANVLVALLTPGTLAEQSRILAVRNDSSLIVSDFAAAEYASVVSRRVRTGALSHRDGSAVLGAFDSWLAANACWVAISAGDIAVATGFLRRLDLTLLSPDAIHIAAAQRLGARLVTLDYRMAAAACALGIAVTEP
jgi:uncharacterized protein